MSVTACNRIASWLDVDDDGVKTYYQLWELITNAATDQPLTVKGYAGLPAIGSIYTWTDGTDANCIRTPYLGLRYRQEKSRRIWRATLKFTNKQSTCQDAEADNPLDIPPKIRGGFAARTKIATKDRNGDPLLNAADEPIQPGLETDDSLDTVIVELNTATLSLTTRAGYKDRVNDASFWGLAARKIKLVRWDYELSYYGACYQYFKNVLEFAINDDTWDPQVLNQGFREKAGIDANNKPLYQTIVSEKDRGPLNVPTLLRADGTKLEDGGAPVFLTFELADEADFSALGLPNPLW